MAILVEIEDRIRSKTNILDIGGETMNLLLQLGATILGVIVKITSKNENVGNVVDGAFRLADLAGSDIFAKNFFIAYRKKSLIILQDPAMGSPRRRSMRSSMLSVSSVGTTRRRDSSRVQGRNKIGKRN